MEDFRIDADHIQLAAMTRQEIMDFAFVARTEPLHLEPRVPFRAVPWPQYDAPAPFDLICLARSPAYTPSTSDALFDAIRPPLHRRDRPDALASPLLWALGISA